MKIREKLTMNAHRNAIAKSSLNDVKTAGSQYLCGFPFSVFAKCLQFFEISCVYKAFQNIL